jgi:hypothetical protein
MLSNTIVKNGNDDGWTFNLHEGFVDSSDDDSERDGESLPVSLFEI